MNIIPSNKAGKMNQLELVPLNYGRKSTHLCQRFVLRGDATAEPVQRIVPAAGLTALPLREHAGELFRLKLLHINDLHGHIARVTPYSEQPIFSRIVWRVRHWRKKYQLDPNAAVLFVSAGDDMAGSLFDELLNSAEIPTQRHAAYHLYSQAGLDTAVVGNHDLDLGPNVLAQAISRDANFPILSANITGPDTLTQRLYPAAMFVFNGVRVGVVGLTTPGQIKTHAAAQLKMADPIKTLNHLLPALRPLCDVLIVVSHLGYSLQSTTAGVVGAGDVELAQGLPYGSVDLIVGGHTHHILNEDGLSHRNVVNGIPIVQAGMLGRFLGEVTIQLNGAPTVTDARLVATADLPADQSFEEMAVRPMLRAVRPQLTIHLGRVDPHPDLQADTVRNDFASGENALANFITAGMLARARYNGISADFAMLDAAVVRSGLENPYLTFADWFNVMPYADTLRLVTLSGRQLFALLQDNATRANRLHDPHTERGFVHLGAAVRYTLVQGHVRAATRATQISVAGKPLFDQLDREFTVVTHSFFRALCHDWQRRYGHELNLVNSAEWSFRDTGLFLRTELVAYIQQQGGVTAEAGACRDGRLTMMQESISAEYDAPPIA